MTKTLDVADCLRIAMELYGRSGALEASFGVKTMNRSRIHSLTPPRPRGAAPAAARAAASEQSQGS